MALNRLSATAANGRVVDVDIYQSIAVIADANGQQHTVPFTLEQVVMAPEQTGTMAQSGQYGSSQSGAMGRQSSSSAGQQQQQTGQQPGQKVGQQSGQSGAYTQQWSSPTIPGGRPTLYPTGLGQGDQSLGATSEGNRGRASDPAARRRSSTVSWVRERMVPRTVRFSGRSPERLDRWPGRFPRVPHRAGSRHARRWRSR